MTIEEFYAKSNACSPMISYNGIFENDAEEAFEFSHFDPKLKSMIHAYCYDKGHSAGYSNIACYYADIVEIAKVARRELI